MSRQIILEKWIDQKLFHAIPMCIAIIDTDYNLVYANKTFEKKFGRWEQKKCYQVHKNSDSKCPDCRGAETFKDGIPRVSEEVGYDRDRHRIHYLQHITPISDYDGKISYLLKICTDITESDQLRNEYQLIFDQAPCSILLIDRSFHIVKINQTLRDMMGSIEGEYCYKGLKGADQKCAECTARLTFADGLLHTGHHSWNTRSGNTVHTHAITVPVRMADGSFDVVMEMAVDITQTLKLEEGLKFAHTFLETMVSTSMDSIFALNDKGKVTIFNPAACEFFKVKKNRVISREEIACMMPEGFLAQVSKGSGHVYLPETLVKTIAGEEVPVRLIGYQLMYEGKPIGMACSLQDLREIRKLEKEKLEAERLAAVGQTVAGLAHGIKNLITALDGGMYMLNSGLGKGSIDRIQKGIEMLSRNIERISLFVKAFLGFSMGREIHVKISNPAEIAKEVVDLYSVKAMELGIELKNECVGNIPPAPIDYESMHECLTNLVGNAIDACTMSDKGKKYQVIVRTFEEAGNINYEIIDNGCGMDYEVKKKVFTSFFTTKGLGGSGLGLLMTKKIVQEHGGRIELHSEPGEGTVFRITLPRKRLPKTIDAGINSQPTAEKQT